MTHCSMLSMPSRSTDQMQTETVRVSPFSSLSSKSSIWRSPTTWPSPWKRETIRSNLFGPFTISIECAIRHLLVVGNSQVDAGADTVTRRFRRATRPYGREFLSGCPSATTTRRVIGADRPGTVHEWRCRPESSEGTRIREPSVRRRPPRRRYGRHRPSRGRGGRPRRRPRRDAVAVRADARGAGVDAAEEVDAPDRLVAGHAPDQLDGRGRRLEIGEEPLLGLRGIDVLALNGWIGSGL